MTDPLFLQRHAITKLAASFRLPEDPGHLAAATGLFVVPSAAAGVVAYSAFNRPAPPKGVMEQGKDRMTSGIAQGKDLMTSGIAQAGQYADKGKDLMTSGIEHGKGLLDEGIAQAGKGLLDKGTAMAGEYAGKGKDLMTSGIEHGKGLLDKGTAMAGEYANNLAKGDLKTIGLTGAGVGAAGILAYLLMRKGDKKRKTAADLSDAAALEELQNTAYRSPNMFRPRPGIAAAGAGALAAVGTLGIQAAGHIGSGPEGKNAPWTGSDAAWVAGTGLGAAGLAYLLARNNRDDYDNERRRRKLAADERWLDPAVKAGLEKQNKPVPMPKLPMKPAPMKMMAPAGSSTVPVKKAAHIRSEELNSDGIGGLLADTLAPASFGGRRAGRATAMSDAIGEDASMNVRHPGTSLGLAVLPAAAAGAYAGNRIADESGFGTGSALGAGAGALLATLLMGAVRNGQISGIGKRFDAAKKISPKRPGYDGWDGVAGVFGGGAHQAGRVQAIQKMQGASAVQTLGDRTAMDVGRETLGRIPYVGAPVQLGYNIADSGNARDAEKTDKRISKLPVAT